MTKSILVIVNPISGDTNKDLMVEKISKEISNRNFNKKIYYTTGKDDDKVIKRLLDSAIYSRVIVIGGDGTIGLVAEHLKKNDIVLGMIAGGSANGLAVNFGIPTDLEEQIKIAFSDSVLKIDTLYINEKFGMHISDLGINAELIKNYDEGTIRGKLGYFIQSIPTLINSKYPFDFKIKANGKDYNKQGVLLALTNATKFGTGATINPDGKINDGKFEILIFKNLNIIEILKTIQDDPHLSSEFVEVISTDRATITSTEKIPFQIDGEYQGEVNRIEAFLEPRAICLAVPEDYMKSQNL